VKIVTYPNPVLSKIAEMVKFPLDKETQDLIKKMWSTVDGQGVGLAAPQVGVSKQICIIHLSPDLHHSKKQKTSFVMINPKIIFYSEIQAEMIEGCLSFPDEFYRIVRPINIKVEYYNENGQKIILQARDWLSRVIQHEVDHLNGKLFINMGGKKIKPEDIDLEDIVD
jgi:peptide deformylase